MKPSIILLERLFAAAKSAAGGESRDGMPASLERRVLACWRSRRAAEESIQGLVGLFQRAFALALAIMLITIAWSYGHLSEDTDDEAIANFEVRADVLP